VSALQLETAAPARSRYGTMFVIKVDISSIELIRNKHFWGKSEEGGVDCTPRKRIHILHCL
jgi:hypothetical protein